jgi:hypothetical protein
MPDRNPYLNINGEVYNHINTSSTYWLLDLKIEESEDSYGLNPLDYISYHFNYWEHKDGSEKIINELNNIIADREAKYDVYLYPELIIYEFSGILVKGEDIDGHSRQEIDGEIILKIKDRNDTKIHIPVNDFEFWDLGSFEEYDDEDGNIITEFCPSSDTLLYFMKPEDYTFMNNYLEELIKKIEAIYDANGFPRIYD